VTGRSSNQGLCQVLPARGSWPDWPPVLPIERKLLLARAKGVLRSFFELGNIIGVKPAASDFFDELFELALVGIENDAFGFDSE
jgi:hypothetical protein